VGKDNKSDKSGLSVFWPKITNEAGARNAALFGVTGAVIVAAITTFVSLFSAFSSPVLGLSVWSLLDAFLFAAIAFGIWKMSRVAALCGLCLYFFEQWYMLTTTGVTSNGAMIALFVLFFVNGIRGTFAYHRLRVGEQSTAEEEA